MKRLHTDDKTDGRTMDNRKKAQVILKVDETTLLFLMLNIDVEEFSNNIIGESRIQIDYEGISQLSHHHMTIATTKAPSTTPSFVGRVRTVLC